MSNEANTIFSNGQYCKESNAQSVLKLTIIPKIHSIMSQTCGADGVMLFPCSQSCAQSNMLGFSEEKLLPGEAPYTILFLMELCCTCAIFIAKIKGAREDLSTTKDVLAVNKKQVFPALKQRFRQCAENPEIPEFSTGNPADVQVP